MINHFVNIVNLLFLNDGIHCNHYIGSNNHASSEDTTIKSVAARTKTSTMAPDATDITTATIATATIPSTTNSSIMQKSQKI